MGASVWASGSQVWNGHSGTLTAKPRPTAANTAVPNVPANRAGPSPWRAMTSNVRLAGRGALLYHRARKPSSITTDPITV